MDSVIQIIFKGETSYIQDIINAQRARNKHPRAMKDESHIFLVHGSTRNIETWVLTQLQGKSKGIIERMQAIKINNKRNEMRHPSMSTFT